MSRGGLSVPSHTAWTGYSCPALHTEACNKHTPERQIESVDAPPTVRLEKTDGCDGWAGIRSLNPAQVKQVKLTCCDPKCLAGELPTCPIGAKRKQRALVDRSGPGRGQPPSSPHPHTGHVPHALQQVQGQLSQPG